jgi:hypothetical protein
MVYPTQTMCRHPGCDQPRSTRRALCDPHFKQYQSEATSKTYRKWRDQVFDVLGRVCVRCGFNDTRALQFDHINGGGSHEARTLGSRTRFFKRILADPSGYQVLCANCNWIKRAENDENVKFDLDNPTRDQFRSERKKKS